MNIGEIITDVRRELVETVGSFWSDAELLDLANRAEKDFVNKARILEDRATMGTQAGRANYPLPANWLSARKVFYNDAQNGVDSWKPLSPTNLERVSRERPNFMSTDSTLRARPRQYFIWNREIWLEPTPDVDGAGNVVLFFKSKPIPFAGTGDSLNIDDSLSEALNSYMLWKAWSKEKEQALAEEQLAIYQDYVRQGRRWVKKQSGDQKYQIDIDSPLSFGGGSDGFNPLAP